MASVSRHFLRPTWWTQFKLDRWITWFSWVLVAAIVLHHVLLIYVLPWEQASTIAFGEAQIVIFMGFAIILGITLWRMPVDRPSGYRWATSLLVLAQGLLLVAALVQARGPDRGGSDTPTMLLFVAIQVCSVWSLAPLVPWRSLPRAEVLRLYAETALVMALCNIVFQVTVPVLAAAWKPTPFVVLTQLRLITSLGLVFFYAEAYRRFGRASRRVLWLGGSGLGWMMLNDMALLWAVVQVADGASGKLIRATGVLWMLQQWCFVMVIYWVMRQPITWTTRRTQVKSAVCLHRISSLQGVLLIGVVLVACVISPSWDTTLLIAGALLSRESVLRYEHARAYKQEQAFATAQAQHAEELGEERARAQISRDLHDSLGAGLTAIGLQLQACSNSLGDHPAIAKIVATQYLTDQLLEEARRTVHNLRAPVVQPMLCIRIDELLKTDRAAGLTATVYTQGTPRSLSTTVEEVLFRAAQEGITNMRRHTHATCLTVHLDYRNPTKVCLRLQDNGQGANCTTLTSGRGLQGMRERFHALGGDVHVQSVPGQGFELIVEVPA